MVCSAEHDYDVSWKLMMFNSTASVICPRNAQGIVLTRICLVLNIVKRDLCLLPRSLPFTYFKLRTNGQQKRATCSTTLRRNELNSDVQRLTTHESSLSCNKSKW